MRNVFLAVAAVCSFVVGGVAQAQARGASHTHDGLLLQMDLGFGSMKSKADSVALGDVEFSGTSGQFSLTLGGALTPNFVLGGTLWGLSAGSPTLKIGGQEVPNTDITLGLGAIGVNLTYYFMPVNLYVSVVPSIATLTMESGGQSFSTNSGFGLKLAVGKEWWVSDNWGIGLNLQYAYASNEDKDAAGTKFGTNWFGAALSATYN